MNVFVLCTGRCGSVTFSKACGHLENYTAGHESKYTWYLPWRLEFPDNHIEADPRLAWYLGPLEEMHGKDAFYVHLTRDEDLVAQSYLKKLTAKGMGQGRAWFEITARPFQQFWPQTMAEMVNVINSNIGLFLKDKDHMTMDITEGAQKFPEFCERIGAIGGIESAVKEFSVHHNAA